MEDRKECYGILMTRQKLNESTFLLKPKYIIKGIYIDNNEERVFFYELGNNYYLSDDINSLIDETETSIYYCITEEELLERYFGCEVSIAMGNYLDETCSYTHFCRSDIVDDGKMFVTAVDLETLLEGDAFATYLNENKDDIVVVNRKLIDNLLKVDDISIIKTVLEEIKEITSVEKESIEEKTEAKTKINIDAFTKDGFIKMFELVFNTLPKSDTLDEAKTVLKNFESVIFEIIRALEVKGIKNEEVEQAMDYMLELIDSVTSIYDEENKDEFFKKVDCYLENNRKKIEEVGTILEKYRNIDIKETKEEKEEKKEKVKTKVRGNIRIIDNLSMKKFLDERVVGQEEAKKDVVTAVVTNPLSDESSDRTSCLLIGPTGSGKTLIIESISKYLDKPMVIVDSTQLSVPGYVGANIDDYLVRLLEQTNGDVAKAEEGIVCFDEIDKKGSEKNSDVSGKGVLNTLLSFMQGTVYDVKYKNSIVHFNTSKLTIFHTGAFTDVAKEKLEDKKAYSTTRIGFNTELKPKNIDIEDIEYPAITREDLVEYGHIPSEFVGRITTISQLKGHTLESLYELLTTSLSSPLLAEKRKLAKIDVELRWTEGYINAVSRKALDLKMGGRALKTIVESSIKNARWEALSDEKYCAIILKENSVEDNLDCDLVDIDGNIVSLKILDLERKNEEKQKVKKK